MNSGQITPHAAKRLQQRGIPEQILPLLFDFGVEAYDHHGTCMLYFNRRSRERVCKALGSVAYKHIEKAMDAYVVLDLEDLVLTVGHRTHRINRY